MEMAFVAPILLLILFGIIDFGWYIYSYSTIYIAARDGAEQASQTPPVLEEVYPQATGLNRDNKCVCAVLNAVSGGSASERGYRAVLFEDLTTTDAVSITYPYGKRITSYPVEVHIEYGIAPLTPLWQMMPLGSNGVFTITATSRRTIQNMGEDRQSEDLAMCRAGADRFDTSDPDDPNPPALPPCHTTP